MASKIPPPPPLSEGYVMPEVTVTAKRDYSASSVPLLPINEPPQRPSATAYNYGAQGSVTDSPMFWLLIAGAVGVAAMLYLKD